MAQQPGRVVPFSNGVILYFPLCGFITFKCVGEHRVYILFGMRFEIDRFPRLGVAGQCGGIILAELEDGSHPATRDRINRVTKGRRSLSGGVTGEERTDGDGDCSIEATEFEHGAWSL